MHPTDLGIILGANGQMAPSKFVAEKKFVEDMINQYITSQPDVRFGAIVYGDDARIVFRFDDEIDSQSAVATVRQLQRRRRGNNLLAALKLANEDLYASRSMSSINRTKTVVILMDKATFRDQKLLEAAKKLKDNGVKIIVVAIGPEVAEKAILGVPSDKDGLIRIRDFSLDASKALREIEFQIPQGKLGLLETKPAVAFIDQP